MRSACAVAPFDWVMNQFPCRRAVVVVPEAVSFKVMLEAAVSVVASCAFTMNWGSVAEACGISVGFRQGTLAISVTSSVETCISGYSPGGKMGVGGTVGATELSQVRLSGAGTVAPTNRLKRLVPPSTNCSQGSSTSRAGWFWPRRRAWPASRQLGGVGHVDAQDDRGGEGSEHNR